MDKIKFGNDLENWNKKYANLERIFNEETANLNIKNKKLQFD